MLLIAQPAKELPRDLTVTRIADGDGVSVRVLNRYGSAATSWAVGCQTAGTGKQTALWHWSNPDWSLEGNRLGPGQGTTVRIPARGAGADAESCEAFKLVAAIFADGTATGDLRWITATMEEQRRLSEEIGKAMDLLTKAAEAGTPPSTVVQDFVKWHAELLPKGMPGEAGPGGTSAYGSSSSARIAPPPGRVFARTRVPAAVRWLIQVKKKDIPQTVRVLDEWRERLAGTEPWRQVTSGLDTQPRGLTPARRVEVAGKPAPEFALRDVDGRAVALKDLRGKAVFLSFWATWCVPCRIELKELQAIHEEYGSRGLVVLGINFSDTADMAREYFREGKYTFGSLLDPESKAFESYGGGAIPKAILIGKDGIVRYYQEGYSSSQDLRGEVAKLGL